MNLTKLFTIISVKSNLLGLVPKHSRHCSTTCFRSLPLLRGGSLGEGGLLKVVPPVSSKCVKACSQLSQDEQVEEEGEEEPKAKRNQGRLEMKVVDVETSMRYMQSEPFKITYGDAKVWMPYRRNYPGPYPPRKTRETCIRGGTLSTGNPCPLCRDEYLVIHEKNIELLKQFIDPHTGEVITYQKTGVCQKRHKQMIIAVLRAYDQGYLEQRVPFRKYKYSDYMKET